MLNSIVVVGRAHILWGVADSHFFVNIIQPENALGRAESCFRNFNYTVLELCVLLLAQPNEKRMRKKLCRKLDAKTNKNQSLNTDMARQRQKRMRHEPPHKNLNGERDTICKSPKLTTQLVYLTDGKCVRESREKRVRKELRRSCLHLYVPRTWEVSVGLSEGSPGLSVLIVDSVFDDGLCGRGDWGRKKKTPVKRHRHPTLKCIHI